jgi:hypothetical protein
MTQPKTWAFYANQIGGTKSPFAVDALQPAKGDQRVCPWAQLIGGAPPSRTTFVPQEASRELIRAPRLRERQIREQGLPSILKLPRRARS